MTDPHVLHPATIRPARTVVSTVHVDDVLVPADHSRGDLGDLTALTASIRRFGVLAPLLVHVPTDQHRGRVHLLTGVRRLAASKLAGRDTVPVILVRRHSFAEMLLVQLAEGLHQPLSIGDRAEALTALHQLGYGWEALGEWLGVDEGSVKALARGMRLPAEVRAAASDAPTFYPSALPAKTTYYRVLRPRGTNLPVPPEKVNPSAIYHIVDHWTGRAPVELIAELRALLNGWAPEPTPS